jgi:F-type H+-transporting ATPase subunit b
MRYLAAAPAGQPPSPLVPSLTEMIIGGIAFLVVFALLSKVLLPRISKTLAERTDAIEGGLKRAEDAQAEAAAVLKRYQDQLAEARHEASRMREEAKEEGARIIAQMREEGQAQADRVKQAAQSQLEAERQQAITSLRAEVGALAVDLAGRIVGESLADAARQQRTVDRFLAELEEQSGSIAGAKASS